MLVIREIQAGKLKEFNEALQKKKREREAGEKMQWHGLGGGRGLAVSYTSLYGTKQE